MATVSDLRDKVRELFSAGISVSEIATIAGLNVEQVKELLRQSMPKPSQPGVYGGRW